MNTTSGLATPAPSHHPIEGGRRVRRHTPAALLVMAGAFAFSACGGSDDSQTVAAPGASSTATAVPTTTPAPVTTLASTTTVTSIVPASTTTVVATTTPVTTTPNTGDDGVILRDDLQLSFDGVGPFQFGLPESEVIYGLEPILGYATSDLMSEYTDYDADSQMYFDADGASFPAPLGREVCYENGLCVYFSGSDAESMGFVGFAQSASTVASEPPLATASGVTVGSVWADFADTMTVEPGCYFTGWGEADGVELILESTTMFAHPDDDGNWVEETPAQQDVKVRWLRNGDIRELNEDDC